MLAQNHETQNYDRGAADGPGLRHRRGTPSSLRGTYWHGDAVRPDDGAGCVTNEIDSAPLLAVSIFLDILNVFQFFLSLFGRTRR